MKQLLLALVISLLAVCSFAQPLDLSQLHGLNFRSIGPAGMSGRVTSIDVVASNNSIIYTGTSAGGLWKSTNAGISFQPIFEGQKTNSVGDIAVYQQNPSILYLGTGEGNPRNSQSYGYGMYRSLDGGKTWKHLGLENTRNIHRVIIHPDNPEVVWVGAIGSAWGASSDRGVFKTMDGGKSWDKILYINDRTGVADMVIDPSNPNKLIVAMWEYSRYPWTMTSGGEGSGIHITMDGGDSWKRLSAKNGLPQGILGRIGLAIAASNPNVVYANVEAEKENAMFRSNDGGNSWAKTTNKGVSDRPFYYSDVEVDPANENRVYHIATTLSKSEDGGKSFQPMLNFFGGVHSDHHAFWINPANPHHILDGNDGGLYTSYDMGKSWRFHHNIPVGQFYHVNVDNEIPYNVYGGMQDNGSWCGPAYKFAIFGKIQNEDFSSVGFGDGFDVIPDPSDNRYGYSMYQGGQFQRYDRKTGLVKNIKPQHPEGIPLRFNWNAAMAIDATGAVYGGSQFVHKSTDKGNSWTIISPDLTTNDPEKQKQQESGGLTIDNTTAENHTTITVIEPSSLENGLLLVGTDDGNVQISRDGGANWTNVIQNFKDLPANSWVTQIKHSSYKEGEAFVVFDDHRRDNWTPYVYQTKNYGKSWKRIVEEEDVWGYVLSFAQDPVEPKLMFVGTEFGLYVSFDGGEKWQKWKSDFPTASAMDMVIHPREHDLVVGTFGRSIYVLDDIRPLRELAADKKILDKDLHLFDLPHAYQGVVGFPSFFGGADESFSGLNRTSGALISYFSKEATKKDEVSIEILNDQDEIIRTLKTTAKLGVNRTNWDLKIEGGKVPGPPDMFSMFLLSGGEVMFGEYKVQISIGEHTVSKMLDVKKDPAMPITDAQFEENIASKQDFISSSKQLMDMYKRVEDVIKGIEKLKPVLATDTAMTEELERLHKKATEFKYRMIPKPAKGISSNQSDLRSQFLSAANYYFSTMTEPDENAAILLEQIQSKMTKVDAEIQAFEEKEIAPLKKKINESEIVLWP